MILDFVPNHTSDQHPWFVESRASRESPKRDWYLWRDGDPPNNWISVFGGRGVDVGRGDRPELLPRVPGRAARPQLAQPRGARGDVRGAAVLERARGRRLPGRRDAAGAQGPLAARQPGGRRLGRARPDVYGALEPRYTADLDEVQEVVAAIRAEIGDERLFMAEVTAPIERLVRYYGADGRGRAPAVQLPPDLRRVARGGDRRAGRALRGGAAGRRVAQLGARQPRPAARRDPRRRRAGARGRDAAADAARHADAVRRRRDRDGGRAGAARARRRP